MLIPINHTALITTAITIRPKKLTFTIHLRSNPIAPWDAVPEPWQMTLAAFPVVTRTAGKGQTEGQERQNETTSCLFVFVGLDRLPCGASRTAAHGRSGLAFYKSPILGDGSSPANPLEPFQPVRSSSGSCRPSLRWRLGFTELNYWQPFPPSSLILPFTS